MRKSSSKQQKKYSVELGFISKLVETKNMRMIKERNIKITFFTGDNKRVFKYIQKVFKETGEVPTARALAQKFPSYELETYVNEDGNEVTGTEESLPYWCNELRMKAKHNTMADSVEKVADLLNDEATEKAYAEMKKCVWYIEGEIVESDSVNITKDTEGRKEAYLERKKNKGIMGIPTGIPHLDYLLKGLIDGTLTTMIATTGMGKAVTLDTPIITPNGFVPMKDIKVGSIVYDEKGNVCNVKAVFPQGKKKVYRVHFEDGTYVDCCKEHLWKFKTMDDVRRNKEWKVETIDTILRKYPIKRGKSFNLSVPVCECVQFSEKELPLNPYVLGCLLGDGGFTTDRITFTNPESDILEKLDLLLSDWGGFVYHSSTNCQFVFRSHENGHNELYRTIKRIGLLGAKSDTKFIPKEYLLGSEEQRLQLVQGLVDTDGHVDKNGHTSFYTSSLQLKEDFMYLIRSLGYRCTDGDYFRKGQHEYVVRISSDSDVFFTSEKHCENYSNRKIPNKQHHYELLKIVDIEELEAEEEMQCISVNSPYSTFLCGDFIVTHNTWFLVLVACYAILQNYKVAIFVTEMSKELMQDRCEAMLFGMMCGDFDYGKFKSGSLDPEMEEAYFDFLDNELPHLEDFLVESVTSVSGIVSVIEQEELDLVLIDSAYLMEDEQGAKDDWLRVTHITRDIKQIANNMKKPFLINSQADQNTTKKSGPGLGDIKYAQSIGQDCLPYDSIILTEQGYKRIQLLDKEVFKVFDGENYKKATCVYAGKKQVTTITYRGNEFSCSPNHKLFVYDNEVGDFVWKRAKDIEVGIDFLLEQNFKTDSGHEHVLRVYSQRAGKEIRVPLNATYELGMFIGVFIGDGSLKPISKGQVTIACGQDIEYANYCIALCKDLFNITGTVKPVLSSTSKNEELLTTWYSVKLADWLSFFCCDSNLNKTVKIDYCEMNPDFRLGVLAGLIQSDGSCISQLEIVSSDYDVIYGANLLMKTFGITTRYDYSHNISKGKNRIRVMSNDLCKLDGIKLVGYKEQQIKKLFNERVCGRLPKPCSYIKKICSECIKYIDDLNSNLYKSVKLAITTGKLGQKYLECISNQLYKFMQVDDVVTTDSFVDMWDIQVFDSDKRIITNGIVNHNSDNVLCLFRDEVMINDKEMGVGVLKQREGILGKVTINWDFNTMNFRSIYSEAPEDGEPVLTENDGVLGLGD